MIGSKSRTKDANPNEFDLSHAEILGRQPSQGQTRNETPNPIRARRGYP